MEENKETIVPEAEATKNRWCRREYWIGGLAVLVTITLCFAAIYYWEYISHLGRYGYLGVFAVNLAAATVLVIPIPYMVVIFAMGSVLDPALVGLAGGLGASAGSVVIYLTGYGGSHLVPDVPQGIYSRMYKWVQRRGSLTIFVMSAVFNPFHAPMTIALAVLRFHLWKFFLLCWAGNTVKILAIAYCGHFGLGSLLRSFGIQI